MEEHDGGGAEKAATGAGFPRTHGEDRYGDDDLDFCQPCVLPDST